MARYPESTKHSLEQRLGARARERWPQLASIAVRHRANFTYIDGVLPDATTKACTTAGGVEDGRAARGDRPQAQCPSPARDAFGRSGKTFARS
jgi:hypothetical protein